VQQSLKLPSVYKAQKKWNESKIHLAEQSLKVEERLLKKEISKAYYTILFWENLKLNYQYLDSLYSEFERASSRRYELGETNYLEQLTAKTKKKEMALQLEQCHDNILVSYQVLAKWMQSQNDFTIILTQLIPLAVTEMAVENHPSIQYYKAAATVSLQGMEVEKKKLLPDFSAEYFLGGNTANNAKLYNGFQIGVGIPLFKKAQQSNIKVAEIEQTIIAQQTLNLEVSLAAKYQQLQTELGKHEKALRFYQDEGRVLSQEIINTSTKAFKGGEIDFLQYLQSLETAKNVEKNYLDNLIQYNLTIVEMQYLMD